MRFLIILSIIWTTSIHAQIITFPYPENEQINIYTEQSDTIPVTQIIQGYKQTYWYDYEFIEASETRFKVKIDCILDTMPNCNLHYIPDINPTLYYWVEKSQCGLYPRASDYDDIGGYFIIYDQPDSVPMTRIHLSDILDNFLHPTDFIIQNDENWAKVKVITRYGIYEGYVNHWCGSVYNSCT